MVRLQKQILQGPFGEVEKRFDPLTGEEVRINPARARRPKQAGGRIDLGELSARTKDACPFCPQNIRTKTPVFPEDLVPGGRVERGESVIFPNLNPFGENHAVGVISEAHILDLDEISPALLRDALSAALEYFSLISGKVRARYPIILFNYLPPSGGSIIHPHIQLLLESKPLPRLRKLLQASRDFQRRFGESFWDRLALEERERGERRIWSGRILEILASFAPRGFNEVLIIFKNSSSIEGLREGLEEFAEALSKLLKGYKKLGISSFNLLSFSGPLGRELPFFRFHFRLISRPAPAAVYTSDTGPFERLADSWVIDTLPEELAEALRPLFT